MTSRTEVPEAPVVSARGVVVDLGGRRVLDDLDLDVAPGESVGVAGASGSGKSTLLRVLAGFRRPDAGTVRWRGGERAPRDGSIAMVFQDAAGSLDPRWPLWRTVAEPGSRVSPADRRAAAEAALDAVGLGGVDSERRPSTLSGGQCQRVAIARVLIAAPALLLADEPTSSLDVSVAAGVLHLLRTVVERGTALVLVSHDPGVLRACGRSVTLAPR